MRWVVLLIGLLMALPAAGQGLTLTGVGTVAAGAGGGPVFATWDSGTPQAVNWTFSNGNLTAACKATYCGVGSQGDVSSTNPVTPSTEVRKLYWEITPAFTPPATSFGVGIVSAEKLALNDGLNGTGGIRWTADGNITADGFAGGNLGLWTTGQILSLAIDFSAKLLWVRPGCAGQWNASGTANPATGTGGASFTGAFTAPTTAFIGMSDGFNANANGATLNTGAGAGFACTPIPSGFVRWQ